MQLSVRLIQFFRIITGKTKIIRIILWGGWGDMLLSTPTLQALKEKYPKCRIKLYCGVRSRSSIFENNPFVDAFTSSSILANPFFKVVFKMFDTKFYSLNYGKAMPSLFYKKNAMQIIADLMDVELLERKIQIFTTEQEDQEAKKILKAFERPICIQINSRGRNKNWPHENWVQIIKNLPKYTFIQLGVAQENALDGAVTLLGKTSFRMTIALIKNCIGFVGIDSGLAHITNAFNVPGVILFGPTSPAVWGHTNNTNVYKALRCSPCGDLLGNFDCPYSNECMTLISIEEVQSAIIEKFKIGS